MFPGLLAFLARAGYGLAPSVVSVEKAIIEVCEQDGSGELGLQNKSTGCLCFGGTFCVSFCRPSDCSWLCIRELAAVSTF